MKPIWALKYDLTSLTLDLLWCSADISMKVCQIIIVHLADNFDVKEATNPNYIWTVTTLHMNLCIRHNLTQVIILYEDVWLASIINVVTHIPTTTVILISCVLGIPLFMIKNSEIPTTIISAINWQFWHLYSMVYYSDYIPILIWSSLLIILSTKHNFEKTSKSIPQHKHNVCNTSTFTPQQA